MRAVVWRILAIALVASGDEVGMGLGSLQLGLTEEIQILAKCIDEQQSVDDIVSDGELGSQGINDGTECSFLLCRRYLFKSGWCY